jgi:hypothetical protein
VLGNFPGEPPGYSSAPALTPACFTHFFFDTLRLEVTTCAAGSGPVPLP